MLFGGIIYVQSLDIIKSEIARADNAILRQIQESVDSRLRNIEQLAMNVELDSRIKGIQNITGNLAAPIQSYNKFGVIGEFRTYMLANEFIDRFYIYFHNSDSILASNGSFNPEAYYEQFYKEYLITMDEWNAVVRGGYTKDYVPLVLKEPGLSSADRSIVFTKSMIPFASRNPRDSLGTIVMHLNLNDSVFQNVLGQFRDSNEGTLLIVNERDELLFTTGAASEGEQVAYKSLPDSGVAELTYDGSERVVTAIQSEIADWKYVSLIPSELFMYKVGEIRRLTVWICLLIVLMGGFLAYFFSRKNYRPIDQLIRAVSKNSGVNRDRKLSEYQFIEETVTGIVAANATMERKVLQQVQTLRDYFLVRLLKGKLTDPYSVESIRETYNISFQSDHFAVLLFFVEDTSGLSFEPSPDNPGGEEELVGFVIKNTVEEFVRQRHLGFVVEVDRFRVCLVNLRGENSAENKRELKNIAESSKTFLAEKFGIQCSVAISGTHVSIYEVKQAYEETIEAIEYRLILGSESLIQFDEIRSGVQGETGYEFSAARLQQFESYVKNGDYKGAKQMINDVIVSNSMQKRVSIDMVKVNLFGLINAVISSFSGFSVILDKTFLDKLDPVNRLIRSRTFPQLEKEIYAIVDEIERFAVQQEKINANGLKIRIVEFVEANYRNPDLSVSMVADELNVSLPYLSKFFKHHTYGGLLEYIQKVRIDKAREALDRQDLGVKEVALLVGYTNQDTFSRLFKKYVGVTPGKYKG